MLYFCLSIKSEIHIFRIFSLFCSFYFLFQPSYAQIDTCKWYSLEVGNKWIYRDAQSNPSILEVNIEVIGDTILNGTNYKVIKNEMNWLNSLPSSVSIYFERIEGEKVFRYSSNAEFLLFDFAARDSSYWILETTYARRILTTSKTNSLLNFLNTTSKLFQAGFIYEVGSKKHFTIPIPLDWAIIQRGIGIIKFYVGGGGHVYLTGAKVNNIYFGTLTQINKQTSGPNKYSLSANYPNPFNPSTVIDYQIPHAAFVQLKIFDILGKEIASLVNEHKQAGIHKINYQPANTPSGIYFYQIRAGKYSETKKMILLR